jgi:hypothetical protein
MPDWKSLLSNPKHIAVAAVVAIAVIAGVALAVAKLNDEDEPAPAATPLPAGPAIPAPPTAAVPAASVTGAAGAPAPPPEPPKDTARITFVTSPAVHATVSWGKQRLGVIGPKAPLVITRPRDSGPLDVVVKAYGYLPVTTRAHTFGDTRITVKLTPPDQQQTLLGYRQPLDAGIEGGTQPFAGAGPEGFVAPPFP